MSSRLSKYFLIPSRAIAVVIISAAPAYSIQHKIDLLDDKEYWGRGASHTFVPCPGPHLESIWTFKIIRNGIQVAFSQKCVDKTSVVRLPNGGRARFVNAQKMITGFTTYMSSWHQYDCKKGMYDISRGYSVQTNPEVPGDIRAIEGAPGFFSYGPPAPIFQELNQLRPIKLVTEEAKFFCPNIGY